ncbi:hypothetical protein BJX96DRAFT_172995 [Aspergillus floccosus]
MDLSSLEGPPIRTPSTSACGGPLPHIQLDTSVLSPSHSDGEYEMDWDRAVSGLPPRPASTHAFASPRHRSYQAFDTSRAFDDRLGVGHITPSSSSHISSPRPRSSYAHPSTHTTALPASPSRRRHPTRLQSHSFSSPHQLVWLDAEKIWVVMAPAPAGPPTTANTNTNSYTYTHTHATTPPARPSLPRLNTPANNYNHTYTHTHTTPTRHNSTPPTLAHARSMDTFFANGELLSPNYEDLPPPYERHIYDQQLAVGAGVSQWTSVARRMNQGPY